MRKINTHDFKVARRGTSREINRQIALNLIRANQPIVPLGDPDPIATTRQLGFIVSAGRGPLTVDGQRRIDAWAQLWHDHGDLPLPLLLTDLDEVYTHRRALQWLAALLPHQPAPSPEDLPSPGNPVGAVASLEAV